jgi:hypothetical protein
MSCSCDDGLCSNNVSLSTFGRRTFQSVDGDPEVASHLPLLQDTCLLLADERRAAMQELPSHFVPAGPPSGISDFGSGVTFSKGGDGCLSGR